MEWQIGPNAGGPLDGAQLLKWYADCPRLLVGENNRTKYYVCPQVKQTHEVTMHEFIGVVSPGKTEKVDCEFPMSDENIREVESTVMPSNRDYMQELEALNADGPSDERYIIVGIARHPYALHMSKTFMIRHDTVDNNVDPSINIRGRAQSLQMAANYIRLGLPPMDAILCSASRRAIQGGILHYVVLYPTLKLPEMVPFYLLRMMGETAKNDPARKCLPAQKIIDFIIPSDGPGRRITTRPPQKQDDPTTDLFFSLFSTLSASMALFKGHDIDPSNSHHNIKMEYLDPPAHLETDPLGDVCEHKHSTRMRAAGWLQGLATHQRLQDKRVIHAFSHHGFISQTLRLLGAPKQKTELFPASMAVMILKIKKLDEPTMLSYDDVRLQFEASGSGR